MHIWLCTGQISLCKTLSLSSLEIKQPQLCYSAAKLRGCDGVIEQTEGKGQVCEQDRERGKKRARIREMNGEKTKIELACQCR